MPVTATPQDGDNRNDDEEFDQSETPIMTPSLRLRLAAVAVKWVSVEVHSASISSLATSCNPDCRNVPNNNRARADYMT